MIASSQGPANAPIATDEKEVTKMGSRPRDRAVLPPRPNLPKAMAFGDASAAAGLLTLFSTFVTARLFESSPLWIFVVGMILGVVSLWLASRAFEAPKGSRGRGTAVAGIVVAIIGMLFCTFGAVMTSILNSDSTL
jgi:hypothetical protein